MGNIHRNSAKNNGKRYCKSCNNKLVKKGKTRQDKQRWLCKTCNVSRVYKRDAERKQRETKLHDLEMFVDYLLNQSTVQRSSGMDRMKFYRKTKHLWSIHPKIRQATEVDVLITDGTYIGNKNKGKMCCIIARDTEHVINYVWSNSEAEEAYKELFTNLPKPRAIVTDGARGSISAVKRLYGDDIVIQRCLFHIKKFIIQKLSTKPKTDAGKELLNITYALFDVKDIDAVEQWIYAFNAWCNKYSELLNEKTYNKRLPNIGHQRKWWYKHKNLRAARSHLSNALDKNQLFSFIYHEGIPPTSNHVEGGINSRIKKLIRCHNGQKDENKMRMIEWYLWSRSKSHNFSDLV